MWGKHYLYQLILCIGISLIFASCSSKEKVVPNETAAHSTVESSYKFPQPELPLKKVSNTIGMEFVLIPPGEFLMGSPATELERKPDERLHLVTFSNSYYIQTTETTQGQWVKVMGENPSHFDECGERCPVEDVSWEDIQIFISKLNSLEGHQRYRLPTEAEWEYACRAGTKTPFSFGQCISTDQVNFNDQTDWKQYNGCPSSGVKRGETVTVASFTPNQWGIYDMHGNVWEWCHDWMGEYPSNISVDPVGPATGKKRIYRGGSQNDRADYCRSALRGQFKPDRRSGSLGFRLAMSH